MVKYARARAALENLKLLTKNRRTWLNPGNEAVLGVNICVGHFKIGFEAPGQ